MKVAQFNFNDQSGGATRAAIRQHNALRSIGIDSSFQVLAKQTKDPTVRSFDYSASLFQRTLRRVCKDRILRDFTPYRANRPDGFEQFSDDRVHLGDYVFQGLDDTQVVNLHWVAGYCDFRSIFTRLLERLPVVWTLHDQNAFTGGCHYDHGCLRYQADCGCCPQLGSEDPMDLSNQVWRRKTRSLREASHLDSFCVVAPSRWLGEAARKSSLFGDLRIEVIPYGLDTAVFKPNPDTDIRDQIGVADNENIVLFLASGAGARRKGFIYLNDAINGLVDTLDLTVITVGGVKPEIQGKYRHIHLGTINNVRKLAAVYSMADVFVIPSIEDNLPLACQEALACGTPVIGFSIGGIPDMVIDGSTGILAPPKDSKKLAEAIGVFFSNPELRRHLSVGARAHAVSEYSYVQNATAYLEVYESLSRVA